MQADFTVSAKEWQAKNARRLEIEGIQAELQEKVAGLEEQSKQLQDEWNQLTLWMQAASRLEPQPTFTNNIRYSGPLPAAPHRLEGVDNGW